MLFIENKIIKIIPTSLILIFAFFSPFKSLAADKLKNEPGQNIVLQENEKNKVGITLLPIIYYTPETRLAFGLGGLFTYRFGLFFKQARPSSLFLAAVYTQMKQFSFQLKPEIYLNNNTLFLTGNLLAERFPSKLWGIGPNTEKSLEETYTPQTYFLEVGLQKKFFKSAPIYFGLKYHLESTKIVEKDPGKLLDQELLPGSHGGLLSGPGLIISFDDRDNIFYPTKGYYLQLFGFWNDRFFGSDFDYFSVKLDLRDYVRVADGQVLAFQAILDSSSGQVPFYKLPRIGGDSILRGYYYGRFRDKNLLAFQTEYRFPIWKKLSGVVFAAMGNVAANFREFKWDNLKYSAGFGLRFKIIPREKANLRVDFAFGPGTYGIYFKAGESF
ncbi:MAG: BamA/TamA family outer membrane protein [Candidatus Saccharicenans sp.]